MEPETKEPIGTIAIAVVRPDFECEGCGHEIFGSRPQRCIKCGGMGFRSRRLPGISAMAKVAESLKRLHVETTEVAAIAETIRHRRRKDVLRQLNIIRGAAAKALRIIVDTPEPTRPPRTSSIGGTPGKDITRVKPPSTAV
ncbi:MAG TPA: hypothetical protein VM008_17310 [Phycisphaerae bacterium]|nr:hypothetical protein [Phycisphaerae bacterium]